jgi:hypothetical protein
MSAAAAKPFCAWAAGAPRHQPRGGTVTSVAKLLLEHRDRWPGFTFLALGERNGGRNADRRFVEAPMLSWNAFTSDWQ